MTLRTVTTTFIQVLFVEMYYFIVYTDHMGLTRSGSFRVVPDFSTSPAGLSWTLSGEIIFTPNKRKQLYLLLSKALQETGIMTAGASSKSGVFTIQLTCSTGLSLRADSSRTGAQSRSAYESNRPHDINKPGSRVSPH